MVAITLTGHNVDLWSLTSDLENLHSSDILVTNIKTNTKMVGIS